MRTAPLKEMTVFIALMWKTAARFSDIFNLRKEDFIEMKSNSVTIFWGRKTKTTALDPIRADMYTRIKGSTTNTIFSHLKRSANKNIFKQVTYHNLTRHIRTTLGANFSTHSIKAGAITQLFQTASQHNFTLAEIQNIARHKSPKTTLGYARNHAAAKILDNSKLTRTL
jgi:integrase